MTSPYSYHASASKRDNCTSSRAPNPVPLFSFRSMHGPATSRWIHSTPSSTKFCRKAAAMAAPGAVSFASLSRSAAWLVRNSWWLSSRGMIHPRYNTCSPAVRSSWLNWWLFPKMPAILCPRPTMIEQVSVDSSTIRVTRQLSCVQVIQSANTSLPSASVSAISTVNPFLLLMMSPGRQLDRLMKFSAIPSVAVTLMGNFSRAMYSMAERQLHAPLLSRNIGCKCSDPFRSNPPESKQIPFPTSATHPSLLPVPRQLRLISAGALLLPLPTAQNRFSPSSSSSAPLTTFTPKPSSTSNSLALFTKYSGVPKQSPLPLASITLLTSALARLMMLWGCLAEALRATVMAGGWSPALRLKEQALANSPLAKPEQYGSSSTPFENRTQQLSSMTYFLHSLGLIYVLPFTFIFSFSWNSITASDGSISTASASKRTVIQRRNGDYDVTRKMGTCCSLSI